MVVTWCQVRASILLLKKVVKTSQFVEDSNQIQMSIRKFVSEVCNIFQITKHKYVKNIIQEDQRSFIYLIFIIFSFHLSDQNLNNDL